MPGLGVNSRASAVAFALPVGKCSKLVDNNGIYVLVRSLWKGPAAVVPWNSPVVQMMTAKIINQERQKLYMEWYQDYVARQKIKSNIDEIYLD